MTEDTGKARSESLGFWNGKTVHNHIEAMIDSTKKIGLKAKLTPMMNDFFLAYQAENNDFFIYFVKEDGSKMYLQIFGDITESCPVHSETKTAEINTDFLNKLVDSHKLYLEQTDNNLLLWASCGENKLAANVACDNKVMGQIVENPVMDAYLSTSKTVEIIKSLEGWYNEKSVVSVCQILMAEHEKKPILDMLKHIEKRQACPEEVRTIIRNAIMN